MQRKPLWQENVADPAGSNRLDSLDSVRRQPVKTGSTIATAATESTEIDTDRQLIDEDGLSFGAVVKLGLQRAGPLKAAAIDVDMDQTQMGRELDRGDLRLKRLDRLTPDQKAAVAEALQDAFGHSADPRARQRSLIRRIRADLDELAASIA